MAKESNMAQESFAVLRIQDKKLACFDKSKEEAETIAKRWEGCGIRCEVIPNSEIPPHAMS